MSVFGDKVRHLRELKGITQEDIANLLGVSRATVSKYESGHREPDIDTIKVLAEYFGVTTDYLFGLTHASSCSELMSESIEAYGRKAQACDLEKGKDSSDNPGLEEIENFMRNSDFIRLAAKIMKNNLDVVLIEDIINNIILLKNQKHPL